MSELRLSDIQSLLDSRFNDLRAYLGGQVVELSTRIGSLEHERMENLANRIGLVELQRKVAAIEKVVASREEAIYITKMLKFVAGIAAAGGIGLLVKTLFVF